MTEPTVLVTGASTGIGRATALALHTEGFVVIASVRRDRDGDALVAAAGSDRTRILPVRMDVTDSDSIRSTVDVITETVADRGLYGLVNNAGITVPGPTEYISLSEFRRVLEVDLLGPVRLIQDLLPALRSGRGRIVNVTSVAGKVAAPFNGPYNAAKHGLEAISDTLRLELASDGIEVSVVEPGAIATAMPDKLRQDADAAMAGLPEEGRVRYGATFRRLVDHVAQIASHGSDPALVARAVVHALTSRTPRTRYPVGSRARQMMLLRRLLPDRVLDRATIRILGLG